MRPGAAVQSTPGLIKGVVFPMNTLAHAPTQRTPSTSLRERVRGQQAAPPPPPTLRGTIDPASLEMIATVVKLVAGQHLDNLAERTGGLVAADQPQMRTAIEGAVAKAIRQAWDRSPHTVPRQPNRPERNTLDSLASELAS